MVHLMPNPTKSPDSVYYFRMRVPRDLTEKVGKDIYSISLRTKDPRHTKTLFTEMLAAKNANTRRCGQDHRRFPIVCSGVQI
ncbi:DUF6538 domain-containing protein [Neorhizobium sp. T25_13]|uniref:DUF6538 domain-containing protein n=1 Tax=Neorhizobium sp. T25_13 TaxID=2093830 RepID=UPI00352A390A